MKQGQPSLSPAPDLSLDELKKRSKSALDLLRKNKDFKLDSALIDDQMMRVDPNYKSEVEKIQKQKYDHLPSASEKKDGSWFPKKQTSKLEQFGSGFLRPFEKMVTGNNPSMMNAYQVPRESLTLGENIAEKAGQVAGYATEALPIAKGMKVAGLGSAVTRGLAKSQVAKTVAGELVEGGIKNRLKSYVGKKVIGEMVDDSIAGAITGAIDSRGDPTAIATGAAFGAMTAPVGQYIAKPIFKKAKQVITPYASKFANYLHENIKEGIEDLSEQEVKQVIQNPANVTQTIAKSLDETVNDAPIKTPSIGKIVDKVDDSIPLTKDTKPVITNLSPELDEGIKQRGFVTTIKDSPNTVPEVAAGVKGKYTPISNQKTLDAAKQAIIDNEDDVLTEVLSPNEATADQVAKAQLLIDKYSNEGKHEQAIQVVENIAKKLTAQGQSIQAASMWNRLSPSGILKTAQRTFNKANQLNNNSNLKLTKELNEKLVGMAEQIKNMPDGTLTPDGIPDAAMEAKTRETLKMMKVISDQVPTGTLRKIDTFQTMSQLLNPKTTTRNVIGNTIFGAVDNAQQTLAAGIDKGVSLATGKRSVLAPNVIEQAKGGWYGIKQGYKDAIQGIDTAGGAQTKFDLPTGTTFKSKLNPLHWAEKTMNVALRVPDRAAYEAAKKDYIRMAKQLAKINGTEFNLDEAIKQADLVAKYRTFQDDTAWAQAFSGIKKALNAGKEFGAGSFLLKYPKTPANLLARAVDYSPVSFLRATGELGKTWFKGSTFNQQKFVTDISKGMTGTGLIGSAYYLAKMGIITGAPNDDKDVSALDRAMGGGKYKLNITGLKRFVDSGFDPKAAQPMKGDKFWSYDWAQPVSTAFAIGANMARGEDQPGLDDVGQVVGAIQGGVDSLYEQPLLSGISQMFRGGSAGAATETVMRGSLSSFTPTIASQVNQFMDNKQRDPFDPNPFKYTANLAKMKVPGLAQDLPQAYDVWGEPVERYKGGTNTMFNVFFNPSFVSEYQPTDESKLVMDLYEMTGETKHAPKLMDRKVRAYGMTIEPDAKTIQSMQQYAGQRTRELYRSLLNNEKFMNLPPTEKVKEISKGLSDIGADTKIKFFGEQFLEMADKSGDRRTFYQAKQDMSEYIEKEQSKNLYDQISVMTPKERVQWMEQMKEDQPYLHEKIMAISTKKLYENILKMPATDRLDVLMSLPKQTQSRVKAVINAENKKYNGAMISGLKPVYAAEYLMEKTKGMSDQEIANYINEMIGKSIFKYNRGKSGKEFKPIGVYKEFLKLRAKSILQNKKSIEAQ